MGSEKYSTTCYNTQQNYIPKHLRRYVCICMYIYIYNAFIVYKVMCFKIKRNCSVVE